VDLKDELLREADSEFAALRTAIAGLDEAALTRPWLGSWGVREVLVHISGWHREMTPALERLARGERPMPEGVSYDDFDAWNARFVAARAGVPVAEILEELERSHRAFVAAARRVPAERFGPGKTAARILDLSGPHHYREHAAQIRDWRAGAGR
jgi:uncharacterized protein (TIGR03083 family)